MKKYSAFTQYMLIIAGAFIMGFAIKNMYDPISLVTGECPAWRLFSKYCRHSAVGHQHGMQYPSVSGGVEDQGLAVYQENHDGYGGAFFFALYNSGDAFFDGGSSADFSFGGVISGLGTGLVFLFQATTGGTDMLAALLQRKLRHYSIAQIMQVLDALVVVAGAAVFGIRYALYALIAIYAVAKVSDGFWKV